MSRYLVDRITAHPQLTVLMSARVIAAVAASSAGLAFWLIVGALVVRWYDARGLHRIDLEFPAELGANDARLHRGVLPEPTPRIPSATSQTGRAEIIASSGSWLVLICWRHW